MDQVPDTVPVPSPPHSPPPMKKKRNAVKGILIGLGAVVCAGIIFGAGILAGDLFSKKEENVHISSKHEEILEENPSEPDNGAVSDDHRETVDQEPCEHEWKIWNLEEKNNISHKKRCSICRMELLETHIWSNAATTEETCLRLCEVCGYGEKRDHELSVEAVDSYAHIARCGICGIEKSEPHRWDGEQIDTEKHRNHCRDCGYEIVEPHDLHTQGSDRMYCYGCGYGYKRNSLTLGWSGYDLSNPFFVPMDEGVQAKCAELGIELLPTHDEKGDATEMINGVSVLINLGIDALVISPFSPESLSVVTALAEEAGIPVVVVDIGTGGNAVDAFIMSDMYGGGFICGEYFLEVVDPAASKNVAIIKCETSATFAITRGEGFKDAVTPAGYTVVEEQHADSNKDKAYGIMQDYLAKYGEDLAAVFCENDQMALGAAAAIDEAGLTGKILVYGFDGNDDAIAAIKEGRMGGTVAQDPFGMGGLGVELAYKLCNGEELAEDMIGDDGNKYFMAPVKVVDNTGNAR